MGRQSEHDLKMARRLREESPADACCFAEQAAQKGLKAFPYRQGSRVEPEHSVRLLAEKRGKRDGSLLRGAERRRKL